MGITDTFAPTLSPQKAINIRCFVRHKIERSGHGRACWGMPGHAPACRDMFRQRAADKPRRQADIQAVQSGADTEPLDTNHRWARVFFLIWETGQGYKTLPHTSYLADSLCFTDPPRFLAHPPPGVLPESDRPIKGPDQRSIGVALSSRGLSYNGKSPKLPIIIQWNVSFPCNRHLTATDALPF